VAGKRRFTVEILGDAGGLERANKRAEGGLAQFATASKVAGRSVDQLATSAKQAARQVTVADKDVRQAALGVRDAQERVAKATRLAADAAQHGAAQTEAAQIKVEKAARAAALATEKYGKGSLEARDAAAALDRAQTAQRATADRLAAAQRLVGEETQHLARAQVAEEAAAERLAAAQRDAAAAAAHLTSAERTAGAEAEEEARHVRTAARAADAHSSSSHRLAGALSAVGSVARSGLTAGLLVAGIAVASTIKLGIDYQSQLNMMQAVTHSSGAEMQAVAKRARDLGNDLTLPATSASDAAHAMTELAKGNLTAKQAMDAAKGTLQLAAAAQIDGATAATIQADALNAFGLKATAASHVADVLANAANSATGEIGDFALGLQASSAIAHQFRLTIDDNVTALALFANAGIHGQDAGTSLKATLLALASPSKQAAEALKVLNLHAFDAKGHFVGLESISQQLASAQGRLSQQTFAAATSTAFGSDAARAAGVLAAAGGQGWEKMAAGISKSGGAATAAKAQMKGVGGAIAGIKSELETIQIDIFTAAAPAIERFLHKVADAIPSALTNLAAGFHSASQPVVSFANGLKGVEVGLAPIGALLPGLDSGLRPIGSLFDKLGASGAGIAKGMAPVKPALIGIGVAGKGAADVFTSMAPMIGETATLMGDAARPIGPLIKAAGDDATRSGLQAFFYNVGRGVANLILWVQRNKDNFKEWAGSVLSAGETVAGLVRHVADFGRWLAKFPGWVVPIVAGLGAMAVAIRVIVAITRTWATVQAALDAAELANPVGLIIIALVGLGVAFAVAWQRSETFRDVVKAAIPILIPIVLALVSPILGIAAALFIAWKRSETFRDVVSGVFRFVAGAVLTNVRFMTDLVLGFVIAVLHAAGRMPGPLGAPFRKAEEAVRRFKETADRQLTAAQAKIDAFGRHPVRKDITVRVIDKATGVLTTITREVDALSGRVVSVKVGAVRGSGPEKHAAGTAAAPPGWAWVGERGPELLNFRGGETVLTAAASQRAATATPPPTPGRSTAGGNTYNINVNVPPTANLAAVGREIVNAIQEYERRSTARWRTA
jgi:TP901 family phage tail tape measure protein